MKKLAFCTVLLLCILGTGYAENEFDLNLKKIPVYSQMFIPEQEWMYYCVLAADMASVGDTQEEYLSVLNNQHIYYKEADYVSSDRLSLCFSKNLFLDVEGDPIEHVFMTFKGDGYSLKMPIDLQYTGGAYRKGIFDEDDLMAIYDRAYAPRAVHDPIRLSQYAESWNQKLQTISSNASALYAQMFSAALLASTACEGMSQSTCLQVNALLETPEYDFRQYDVEPGSYADYYFEYSEESKSGFYATCIWNEEQQIIQTTFCMEPSSSFAMFHQNDSYHQYYYMPTLLIDLANTEISQIE